MGITILSLTAAVFTAFSDFCIAGVTPRYVCDILTPLVFLGTIGLLSTSEKETKPVFTKVIIFGIALTLMIAFCSLFSKDDEIEMLVPPDRYLYFENLLSLW